MAVIMRHRGRSLLQLYAHLLDWTKLCWQHSQCRVVCKHGKLLLSMAAAVAACVLRHAARQVLLVLTAEHQTLSLCVLAGLVHSWQRETVTANPWLQNMPITEVVSIILRQLPWMMFSKAILQTGHHLSPLLLAAAAVQCRSYCV